MSMNTITTTATENASMAFHLFAMIAVHSQSVVIHSQIKSSFLSYSDIIVDLLRCFVVTVTGLGDEGGIGILGWNQDETPSRCWNVHASLRAPDDGKV